MKELELTPAVTIEQKRPGLEQRYLTSLTKVRGHRFFELDLETGIIIEIPLTTDEYHIGSAASYKVFTKPHSVFVQALNKKNAIKVFKREGYINEQQEVIFDWKKGDDRAGS